MTRQIELGLGDIIVTCNDKNIYIMKAVPGTPGKILLSYELQENGTCKQNVMPAFNESKENCNVDEPFRISMTSIDGGKATYTEDEMLGIIRTLNIPRHVKSYLAMLAATDIETAEDLSGEETRVYNVDDDIEEFLEDEEDFYDSF